MGEQIIKTPPLAESIQEGTLAEWLKKVGEFVARDEPIATIETDKVAVTINSPESGTILEQYANDGDTVTVGGNLYRVELGSAPPKGAEAPKAESKPEAKQELAKAPEAPKQEAPKPAEQASKPTPPPTPAPSKPSPAPAPSKVPQPASGKEDEEYPGQLPASRTERRVPMNRMRQTIASRLKESQNTAASLTTFNEVDMSNLIELRKKYKDLILEKHGVKLGFMGAFIKAATAALREVPAVNARIEGKEIVYADYMDISVAVATPKGLVTPAIRNCETMSIVQLEKAMAALGKKAKDNAIAIEDLAGGTFTISNGGVFGSLYGTPIINAPQSAILGMHATKERAVVVNGQVVVRPMMYLALTYDHRIIDGREAVTFLVKIKEAIEDPRRLLLDI
ncbi:2-oxoglutarate dehydrogenase complex E2 component [Rhizophlyctis rosea]|uniref:dihydrolipoyllysine-residue succinyltransferase n=1 Tax=Rhizophlyctis rosea TaxID=64517 RepID=A0AAD5SJR8_9FUNG|nr:2-oxoglutarate dehydrogenase complex E2 component [Rhizophlyctis rosea]